MHSSRLTRGQIAQALDQLPASRAPLAASTLKQRSLTAKQMRFAEKVALGSSKAAAYRSVYESKAKPATQSQSGCRLAADPRIAAQIGAFKVAAEAKRYATPAALRSLVIEQLTAMAVNPDVKDAQRLRALELLGKVTEVAAFTERRELVKVTESGDARTRLVDSLRQALAVVDVQAIEPDLLAELKPAGPGDVASDAGEGLVDSAGDAPTPPAP